MVSVHFTLLWCQSTTQRCGDWDCYTQKCLMFSKAVLFCCSCSERYRDLISAADTIKKMKECAEKVSTN